MLIGVDNVPLPAASVSVPDTPRADEASGMAVDVRVREFFAVANRSLRPK